MLVMAQESEHSHSDRGRHGEKQRRAEVRLKRLANQKQAQRRGEDLGKVIMRVTHRSQTCLDGLSQDVGLLGAAGPHQRQQRKTVKTDLAQRHRQERRVRLTHQGYCGEPSPGRKSLEGLKAPPGRLAAAAMQGVVVRSRTQVT